MVKTVTTDPESMSVAEVAVRTREMPIGVPASGADPSCDGVSGTSLPQELKPTRLFSTILLMDWPLQNPVRYSMYSR